MVDQACMNIAYELAKDGLLGDQKVDAIANDLKEMAKEARRTGKHLGPTELLARVENQINIRKLEKLNRRRQIKLQADTRHKWRNRLEAAREETNKHKGQSWAELYNTLVYGNQGTSFGSRVGLIQQDRAIQKRMSQADADADFASNGEIGQIMRNGDEAAKKQLLNDFEAERLMLQLGEEGAGGVGSTKNKAAMIWARHVESANNVNKGHFYDVGGEMGQLADHGARQSHNRSKISAVSEQEYGDFIEDLVDWYRTFGGVDPTEAAKENFKKTVYHNIINTQPHVAITSYGSGVRQVKTRKMHFKLGKGKDIAKARQTYREKFGTGNYLDAVHADGRFFATSISAMDMLGPNPNTGLQDLNKLAGEMIDQELNPLMAKVAPSGQMELQAARTQAKSELGQGKGFNDVAQAMRYLDGKNTGAHVGDRAQAFQNFRAWQAATKLGGAAINSFVGDPAVAFTTLMVNGGGMEAFADYFRHAMPGTVTAADRRRFASFGKAMQFQTMSSNRYGDELLRANPDNFTSKAADFTVKWTGLDRLTRNYQGASQLAMQDYISRVVDDGVEFGSKNMDVKTLETLRRAGITKAKYDAFKHGLGDFAGDGGNFIEAGNFPKVGDDADFDKALRNVAKDRLAREREGLEFFAKTKKRKFDEAKWEKQQADLLQQTRTELITDFDRLIIDEAQGMTLVPDEQTLDTMRFGGQPGSMAGDIMTTAGQFLSFPVKYYDAVLRRGFRQGGGGIGSYKNLAAAGMVSALSGAMIIMTKDLVKGRDPFRHDFASKEFMIQALDKGGFFSVIGNIIVKQFSEHSRQGAGVDDMMGPGASFPFEVWEIFENLANGKMEKAGRDIVGLGKSNIPFNNAWQIDWLTSGILLDGLKDTIDPGYLDKRKKKFGY